MILFLTPMCYWGSGGYYAYYTCAALSKLISFLIWNYRNQLNCVTIRIQAQNMFKYILWYGYTEKI